MPDTRHRTGNYALMRLSQNAQRRNLGSSQGENYAITGSGTVEYENGVEALLADDFAGTVRVPNGVRATVPARLAAVVWDGAGEVVHAGDVPVRGMTSPVTTVLVDGSDMPFGVCNAVQGDTLTVPGFSDVAAWNLSGGLGMPSMQTLQDSPCVQESRPAEIVAGRLVLTDTVGKQQRGAFLKDFTFMAGDAWEISFKWRAWVPSDQKFAGRYGFTRDLPSYFFSCVLRAADDASSPLPGYDKVYWPATAACGFSLGGYGGGSMGLSRVWKGTTLGAPDVDQSLLPGGSLRHVTDPFIVHLRCNGDGRLAVTLTRDTDDPQALCSYGFTCDVSEAFSSGAAVLGFTGSTDGTSNATEAMWARQEVWDLTGSVVHPTYEVTPDGLAFTSNNWCLCGNGWKADGSATLANAPGEADTREYIVSYTGVPVYVPFVYSCDFTSSRTKNVNAASYSLAMYLQMSGAAWALPSAVIEKAVTVLPEREPAYGIFISGYAGTAYWTSPDGGVGTLETAGELSQTAYEPWSVVANATNHLTLTYDGWDTFTFRVSYSDGRVFTSRHRYANLADGSYAGRYFHPTFVSAEFWGNNQIFTLSNVSLKTYENPVARVAATGLDFTSANWSTPDAASSWTAPGVLQLSNHQGSGGVTRERLFGTQGLPAHTPFEWTMDCTSTRPLAWKELKSDQRFGMYVQTGGTGIAFASPSASVLTELPTAVPAFGMTVATYGGTCRWACPNGAVKTVSDVIDGTGWMQTGDGVTPNRLCLRYDGQETFTFEALFPDGHRYCVSHRYAALANGAYAGKTFYPTVVSGSSFGSPLSRTFVLSNLSVKTVTPTPSSAVSEGDPLAVAAGAACTFTVAQRGVSDAASAQPGVRFADVSLAAGATLSVVPQLTAAKAAFEALTVSGNATLAAGTGAALVLGDLTFTSLAPVALTVTGPVSFATPQTITVPQAWRGHGGVVLVDCTGAQVVTPPAVENIVLLDENGQTYGPRARVVYGGGCLRWTPAGMSIIIR